MCITHLQYGFLNSTGYVPSLFQIIPVFLEYQIPQKITEVTIVCSCFLYIVYNTNTLKSLQTENHALVHTYTDTCNLLFHKSDTNAVGC